MSNSVYVSYVLHTLAIKVPVFLIHAYVINTTSHVTRKSGTEKGLSLSAETKSTYGTRH